jgi:selenocysteine lyase/cysteine desulfurase
MEERGTASSQAATARAISDRGPFSGLAVVGSAATTTSPRRSPPFADAIAGGTIVAVSVQATGTSRRDDEAGFEDGTINYLALPAVEHGLDYLSKIGIDTVHARVRCLTEWLLEQLGRLRHANGRPVEEVYGPRSVEGRGATIAFTFFAQTEVGCT